jgi:serine phosphatase RsbU (regulator of sigma subunit)
MVEGTSKRCSEEVEPRPPLVIDAERRCQAVLQGQEPLAVALEQERREFERLRQIMSRVNLGLRLENVLDFVYTECRDLIPYHRIAFAVIDHARRRIEARWSRSDGMARFPVGYGHAFETSSLMSVADRGRPRIINDLAAYVREHPHSDVTRLLVDEGLRSSLTCPLTVEGRAVGFLFFDHREPGIYSQVHVDFFIEIAEVIAYAVERARLFNELSEQKATIERQNRELADENTRRQHELEMARLVQQSLIPDQLPTVSGLEMAMLYEPAELVGGDLLVVSPVGTGRALVTVADAMGHGVPAALMMTVVRTALHGVVSRPEAISACDPAAMLRLVNRTVVELFLSNYVTAASGLIDVDRSLLRLSLAGHPPPMMVPADGGDVVAVEYGQIPLGIEADTEYSSADLPFGPGDLLLLYTDGIIEAAAPDRSRYGLESLKRALLAARGLPATEVVERVRQDLRRHCGSAALEDDMAMLAVRRPPAAADYRL